MLRKKLQRSVAIFVAATFLVLPLLLMAAQVETGLEQYQQPNAVVFNAWYNGSEFYWERETDTGYTIILNLSDGYWYYATLGAGGHSSLAGSMLLMATHGALRSMSTIPTIIPGPARHLHQCKSSWPPSARGPMIV